MALRDLIDIEAFEQTRRSAVRRLLDERNEHGWWTGELSSSALSTATAVTALAIVDRERGETTHTTLIKCGIDWLARTQNADGGWGDTVKSFSNISTTTLVWAAFKATGHDGDAACADLLQQAEARLREWTGGGEKAGAPDTNALIKAIAARYGDDRTFSVPILTMCALAGRLGDLRKRETWQSITPLPFELAAFPRGLFAKLNLRVVSYALPALIAIGQVRHHFAPTRNPITRVLRDMTRAKTLRLLDQIQPPNGGFLEATPLTSFVTMSLAACGLANHAVTNRGVSFIVESARADGSWAIDTNLATWVTTLSVNALAAGRSNQLSAPLGEEGCRTIRDWLLGQQYKQVHPYTGAAPGGWSWTDLPGGVPDADDTSGAVLALCHLDDGAASTKTAIDTGVKWLRRVQNRNGGIPTFCKGWGRLPFDRSSADITAHYLAASGAAWRVLNPRAADESKRMLEQGRIAWVRWYMSHPPMDDYVSRSHAYAFLKGEQRSDGAIAPLWFGCQHMCDETNWTYGTARVVPTLNRDDHWYPWHWGGEVASQSEAIDWLLRAQDSSGGWGGGARAPSSIEETALAAQALACAKPQAAAEEAIARGVNWLIENTQHGTHFDPAPIGFYFAKLWYFEKLYPIIFTVAALQRVAVLLEDKPD